MKKTIRIFGKILGSIIIGVVITAVVLVLIPSKDQDVEVELNDDSSWMTNLNDSLPLNQILLPGSHNSASKNVKLGLFNKCQDESILTQLQSGCRYLSIGLGEYSGELVVKVGKYSCKSDKVGENVLSFQDILDECYLFLETNPSETILIGVNYEYGNLQIASFEDMLKSYINDKWYTSGSIPELGEVRGKIVLLRKYEGIYGIPFIWKDQKRTRDATLGYEANDNVSYVIYAQDRYEYDNDEKWSAFISDLGKYDDAVLQGAICYNGLNTNGSFSYNHPIMHAKLLNNLFIKEDISSYYGWYIFDFFNSEIARHVYKNNFNN